MIETTIPITYENRISKHFYPDKTTNNGGISNKEQGKLGREPEPTCETCKYQRDGICNRYPLRYMVKSEQGFLIACGEYVQQCV